jgi:hypothetical protein
VSQVVVVVAVFIVGENAEPPLTQHFGEGMVVPRPTVLKALGHAPGQSPSPIEFTHR